ncbi:MAG: HNH endonuclease [Verrucomicrobiae bacterium]|nr:HNH endonuclease [Verrucomicrobiae bacterium]
MSRTAIPAALRLFIHQRAAGRCEYCRLHDDDSLLPHEPDHIIATQHGGEPTAENLALACFDCNRFKGPNLSSIDPESGAVVPLFNPRREVWAEHFRADGARIVALTAQGRATVTLLRMNARERLLHRQALLKTGRFPD